MKLPFHIRSIIIFRALQLGDLLCCIPAIRSLRTAFPQAEITLAGLPWARSLTERFPDYINSFIHFPGYPGLPEQPVNPAAFTAFLQTVQNQQFGLALQMQGNGTLVNPVVELFGATHTAGFCTQDDYCPDPALFLEYPDTGSEIERHLALMDFLGIPSQGTQLEFPLTGKDYLAYERLQLPVIEKNYVCIHPGSRGSWRQWPPEYFALLGDYCVSQGMKVILTGTQEELPITQAVQHHMKEESISVAGKTTLGAAGVLINGAFALISNCTGVSHMAAAFSTPSVVISMDGEPERWGPLNKTLHSTIDWTKQPDFDLAYRETVNLFRRYRP